jgi:hypothetical protein
VVKAQADPAAAGAGAVVHKSAKTPPGQYPAMVAREQMSQHLLAAAHYFTVQAAAVAETQAARAARLAIRQAETAHQVTQQDQVQRQRTTGAAVAVVVSQRQAQALTA